MTTPLRQSTSTTSTRLAAEKARANALFASIGEAVIATNEDGKIMKVNEAALELLGYDENDLVGKGYLAVMHAHELNGEQLEPLQRPVMRALLEGTSVTDTLMYRKKDGSYFAALITAAPIILNGKPVGTIEVVRDVTREQQVDRAKTEFVSLASHQLRTPLTAIRWYIELMLAGKMGKLAPEQEAGMREIHGIALRLIELVGALLSVARIEIGTLSVNPVPCDIEQLAHSVIAELKPQISEKNLIFNEYYDATLPPMNLDPDLTRVVFQNLLTNAVKYTPKGGSVDLKIERMKRHVLIEIADTGYGVPKNQQRQLFTKLFRADNARQQDTNGTGLGLYIVKSIVTNAGGKIWFESEENKGTKFYVRLPLKKAVVATERVT